MHTKVKGQNYIGEGYIQNQIVIWMIKQGHFVNWRTVWKSVAKPHEIKFEVTHINIKIKLAGLDGIDLRIIKLRSVIILPLQ